MADAVACARAPSRSAHISAAPSLANRLAMAVPRPPPAPVTSATFPFSLIDLLLARDGHKQYRRPAQDISFQEVPGAAGQLTYRGGWAANGHRQSHRLSFPLPAGAVARAAPARSSDNRL